MNKICSMYFDTMKEEFNNIINSIIIYGSNIYDVNDSDLDICIIADDCDEETLRKIIDKTIKFHIENNLKIDNEIPYENKLIYSKSEIIETLKNPPFYVNGKVEIRDVIKDENFLNSKEMKQRLLLNILTTDHVVMGDDISNYETLAFKIMIDVITSYFNISNNNIDEVIEAFYKNKYTNAEGEMYLGYKKENPLKDKYLKNKIKTIIKTKE